MLPGKMRTATPAADGAGWCIGARSPRGGRRGRARADGGAASRGLGRSAGARAALRSWERRRRRRLAARPTPATPPATRHNNTSNPDCRPPRTTHLTATSKLFKADKVTVGYATIPIFTKPQFTQYDYTKSLIIMSFRNNGHLLGLIEFIVDP